MTEPVVRDDDRAVLEEMRWLVANSEGVLGLRLDGAAMTWAEVIRLYLPSWRS